MKSSDDGGGDRRLHLVGSICEEIPEEIPSKTFEKNTDLFPEVMPKENPQEGKDLLGMVQNKI